MTEKPQIRSLADLAKLAGVTPGTVSRALSGTGLIGAATRERIRKLAEEHDYRPNILARNLRTRRTGAIGVILPLGHEKGQHVSDPFFMTLLGHLADALTERGYDLLLSRVIPADDQWLDRLVRSGRVDGVIVIGQSDQTHVLEKVAATYRPMVVWGARNTGAKHCTVGSDNRAGGAMAAQHLIATGCKRIVFFGDPGVPEFAQRLEGVERAVKAAGLSSAEPVLPVHLTPETAYGAICDYLAKGNPADGIVTASDIIAMNAIRALHEHGYDVPGKVAVTGFDDISIAAHTTPPLTTIRQDLERGAALLAELLLKRIGGEETTSVELAPELIVRGSTRG
jgi:DNA-binding LacI/PurR family transcriptional regulator